MTPKIFISSLAGCILLGASSSRALPENQLNTHNGGVIPQAITNSHGDFESVRAQFSKTGVASLDALWNSRQDFPAQGCPGNPTGCRVLSVFRGSSHQWPVVLMPGFTGYRKMYLEQIRDLLDAGFGPIYISDFTGTGDSYKPELKEGQSEPEVSQFIARDFITKQNFESKVGRIVGESEKAQTLSTIEQLPIGIGYIENFLTYNEDVDFIMNYAVAENPHSQILVHAMSMSGLAILLAVAEQNNQPTWITHVKRILLESPMIRIKSAGVAGLTDALDSGALTLLGSSSPVPLGALSGMSDFADKAFGNFNPKNLISHSESRLTLTDSIRTWNGHETVGATTGWVRTVLQHEYSLGGFFDMVPGGDPLNHHEAEIRAVLQRNHITLVDISSEQDPIVNTAATKMFLNDIKGASEIHLCLFQTSRHVIDQESDLYRQPYMQLFLDQSRSVVKSSYGTSPANEVLNCQELK